MGIDYYAVLNVPRTCSQEEIQLAYKRLAIISHPKNKTNGIPEEFIHLPGLTKFQFWELINEAFDVLNNPKTREIYNLYGEEGLKEGHPLPYMYHGDHMKTYNEAFGSNSPFANLIDSEKKSLSLHSMDNVIGAKRKDPNLEIDLPLDIREAFHGTVKSIKIFRRKYDPNQFKTILQEHRLLLPIPPGSLPGTKFVFREEGDQGPAKIPGNVIFKVQDMENGEYRRDGSDLHMKYTISLLDALCGFGITIKTVDDRQFNIMVTDIVGPHYVKRIANEGLPLKDNPKSKGDLCIHFDIIFPTYIPYSAKNELRNIFEKLPK